MHVCGQILIQKAMFIEAEKGEEKINVCDVCECGSRNFFPQKYPLKEIQYKMKSFSL